MAQITVNLIHDLRVKHKVKEQIPFVYGLRTGFLRAWLFTGLKVLFIFSLLNGTDLVGKLEANISLLDQYVRDDYTVLQNAPIILPHLPKKTAEKVPIVVGLIEPRGLPLADGSVASASTFAHPSSQP
jgi:hypothetical protein